MPKLSKKAQAAQLQAERETAIRAALHWTEPAGGPDVPPPDSYKDGLTTGYTFFAYVNTSGWRVAVACSSAYYHAVDRTDKTTAQQPISLYSTRELALRALRNQLEREFAAALADVDAQIERAAAAERA